MNEQINCEIYSAYYFSKLNFRNLKQVQLKKKIKIILSVCCILNIFNVLPCCQKALSNGCKGLSHILLWFMMFCLNPLGLHTEVHKHVDMK